MPQVTDADREAAKWRHGPTCAYHAFADRDCTCGAWLEFAAHREAERGRIVSLILEATAEWPLEYRELAQELVAEIEKGEHHG